MSLITGPKRSVSHSCLVRSSIEMPEELEERVKNLDEVFTEQISEFNKAENVIRSSLKHPVIEKWPQIEAILEVCQSRVKEISSGDYVRAMSYGAMRIVNTRMTEVLNVVRPIKNFMSEAIQTHDIKV